MEAWLLGVHTFRCERAITMLLTLPDFCLACRQTVMGLWIGNCRSTACLSTSCHSAFTDGSLSSHRSFVRPSMEAKSPLKLNIDASHDQLVTHNVDSDGVMNISDDSISSATQGPSSCPGPYHRHAFCLARRFHKFSEQIRVDGDAHVQCRTAIISRLRPSISRRDSNSIPA
jgi:hypothetical protein